MDLAIITFVYSILMECMTVLSAFFQPQPLRYQTDLEANEKNADMKTRRQVANFKPQL